MKVRNVVPIGRREAGGTIRIEQTTRPIGSITSRGNDLISLRFVGVLITGETVLLKET